MRYQTKDRVTHQLELDGLEFEIVKDALLRLGQSSHPYAKKAEEMFMELKDIHGEPEATTFHDV